MFSSKPWGIDHGHIINNLIVQMAGADRQAGWEGSRPNCKAEELARVVERALL
jgi:hypothetical protein